MLGQQQYKPFQSDSFHYNIIYKLKFSRRFMKLHNLKQVYLHIILKFYATCHLLFLVTIKVLCFCLKI